MAVVSTGQITITDVNDYTYQGTTAPKNPIPNVTIWIDTSVSPSVMKRWTGTVWEIINEVKIGGRNLLLGSKNEWNLTSASWAYIPLSEPLDAGKTYIFSCKYFENTGSTFFALGLNLYNGVGTHFVAIPMNTPFVATAEMATKTHLSFANQLGTAGSKVAIHYPKLESGNKATDWTSAPEDIDAKISAEAQKVINLENKTDFLTGTTIEGNAVATGTLLVGNSDGTNAGITGIGSTSDGVYLWGGGTYQQMVQGLAKKEQRRNGIDIWRHPNGQIGFEIGIKDGRLIFNGYHESGFKLFELDPNRGLIAVAYTQESWTETPFRKLTYSSSTFNESTIASEIQGFISKSSRKEYLNDSDFVWNITYSILQNAVGYDYDNGTNPANSAYESLNGMKANNNDRDTNITNGWYISSIGEVFTISEMNRNPLSTYTFTVYVYYYQDGKITQTKVVTVTK